MSETLDRVRDLAAQGDLRVSEHGYDQLSEDGILVRDVIAGLSDVKVVEDYPDYPKGPCVLVLQYDRNGFPLHIVWGMPKGETSPAVLVTAYRPDTDRWTDDFLRRKA